MRRLLTYYAMAHEALRHIYCARLFMLSAADVREMQCVQDWIHNKTTSANESH